MTFILVALLVATLISCLSIFYTTLVSGISPMPTSRSVKNILLKLLATHQAGNKVYELGSGWGTLVFPIAREFPHHQVTGLERSPIPYLYSQLVNRILQRKNITFIHTNFFNQSFAETDTVVCYLCTGLMSRLKEKLEKELAVGALVVSNTFAVPGWKPIEVIIANDMFRSKVYVYRIGMQV